MTSADVKEIQGRNAAARGRVIAAGDKALAEAFANDGEHATAAKAIEAAMMELAAVWREEAAHVTAAKRKGHVSIAKEYTMAAARLAGFAVGLTTRPIAEVVPTPPGRMLDAQAQAERWYGGDEPHDPQCDCGRPECAALALSRTHPAEAISTLKGGSSRCTACGVTIEPACGNDLGGGMTAENPEQLAAFMRGETNDPGVVHVVRGGIQFPALAELVDALPAGDPLASLAASLDVPSGILAIPSVGNVHEIAAAVTAETVTIFSAAMSEEQNLRDIIGPLGVTATIDHPFTNPGVPWLNKVRAVEVVPYAQLPVIALATPPRDHVSHSYVETYEGCSLSAMLRDASRAGHIGASRPGWSMIGGSAFHNAVEMIERMALSNVTVTDDPEALWLQHFDAAVKERMGELVGTPYADSSTWYISNRGKEGFDWWRVEGAKMLALYVKHHSDAWRAASQTFLLQDTTPVIEYGYSMTLRSLDGERGLTAAGFVDRATLDMSSYSLTVIDYKTGSREPESTFQLGEYGHALLMAMGIPGEPPDRPILGRYWLARKGIYTDPVPVVTRHPLAELQYRYDAAARGTAAKIFAPHVTNLCKSCSVTDYCPAQAGRS